MASPKMKSLLFIILAAEKAKKSYPVILLGSSFSFVGLVVLLEPLLFWLVCLLTGNLFNRLISCRSSNISLRLHFHDIHFIFLIPLIRFLSVFLITAKVTVVLDLHELPYQFILRNQLFSLCLVGIFGLCDKVIFTNELRRRYVLRSISRFSLVKRLTSLRFMSSRTFVVENYPDETSRIVRQDFLGSKAAVWIQPNEYYTTHDEKFFGSFAPSPKHTFLSENQLQNLPYILWIGSCGKGRMFPLFCRLISTLPSHISVIMLGSSPCRDDLIALSGRNVYTLSVPSSEVSIYIRYSLAIPVFYASYVGPNNRMCSPNKFFDSLFCGTPVFGPTCLSFDYLKKELTRLNSCDLLEKCLIAEPQVLLSDFPGFIALQLQNFADRFLRH